MSKEKILSDLNQLEQMLEQSKLVYEKAVNGQLSSWVNMGIIEELKSVGNEQKQGFNKIVEEGNKQQQFLLKNAEELNKIYQRIGLLDKISSMIDNQKNEIKEQIDSKTIQILNDIKDKIKPSIGELDKKVKDLFDKTSVSNDNYKTLIQQFEQIRVENNKLKDEISQKESEILVAQNKTKDISFYLAKLMKFNENLWIKNIFLSRKSKLEYTVDLMNDINKILQIGGISESVSIQLKDLIEQLEGKRQKLLINPISDFIDKIKNRIISIKKKYSVQKAVSKENVVDPVLQGKKEEKIEVKQENEVNPVNNQQKKQQQQHNKKHKR